MKGGAAGTISEAVSNPSYVSYLGSAGIEFPAAGTLTSTRTGHFGYQDIRDWIGKTGVMSPSGERQKPSYDVDPRTNPALYGLW